MVVQHDHVLAERQHDAAGVPAGPGVLLQQPQVTAVAHLAKSLVDLPRGRLDKGDHQRVGVPPPAGQVDHADGLAGHRVLDRDPGAGHALEVLRVVLVPEHVGGPAGLQRRPDAVGADDVLGVGEPGRQHDRVQVPLEVVVAGVAEQHQASGVGEHDADRLAVQLVVQVPQHRLGGAGQRRLQVGRPQVGQPQPVRRDVPLPGPPPGRQDRLPDRRPVNRQRRQEPVPGRGQAISSAVQPR